MNRRFAIAVGTTLVIAAGSGLMVSRTGSRADAATAVPMIAPSKAAALVAATSGAAAGEVKALGDQARLINAALPFDAAPVAAARPFAMAAGDSLDHRRALLCMTQAVYYEAGFEPIEGRRAVAQVVLNRLRHPAFPKSVCGVVYQGSTTPVCQFSFVCDGALYRRPALGAWHQAAAVATAALAGYVERSVGEATHYHANYVAPRWAPMLAKVAQLGAHIFYRWPGAWGQAGAFNGHYIGEPNDPLALRPALRPAVSAGPDGAMIAAPVVAGVSVARAPEDVGGLLDPSKGWTLNIPMPSDAGLASQVIATQQQAARAAAVTASAGAIIAPAATPTLMASR